MPYKNKEDQAAAAKSYYMANKSSANKNRLKAYSEKSKIISDVIRMSIEISKSRHLTFEEIRILLYEEFDRNEFLFCLYKCRGVGAKMFYQNAREQCFQLLYKRLRVVFKDKYPDSIISCGLFLGTTTRSLVRNWNEYKLERLIPKNPVKDCKAELLILNLML